MKKAVIKLVKITGITMGVILMIMVLVPILFPTAITEKIKVFANEKIDGELNFSKANLSFFHHFPSLTLTLNDFSLKGSLPFKKDSLLYAKDITFGIDISSLIFKNKVDIDQIFISNAFINIKVNEKGEANYNVYKSNSKSTDTSGNTALKLAKIEILDTRIKYDDKSAKFFIDAKNFNYTGNGDLDADIFDLFTKIKIGDFNLDFDGETYLKKKNVNANLITRINTSSLSFMFKQNDLLINKLPISFIGKFDILKSGYNIDFNIKSEKSQLNDFFTALPPQYVAWLEKSKVSGITDVLMTLKGKYSTITNQKPDLDFGMKIRDGYIAYKGAPLPASNVFLDFKTKLPSLNTEKLIVNVDSIFLNVGKDYLKGKVKMLGLQTPVVDVNMKSYINLENLNKALGLKNLTVKGLLDLDVVSKGKYDKAKNLFPVSNARISFKNGYIKTQYYPNPIQNIQLEAVVKNNDASFKSLEIAVTPATLQFEGKPFFIKAFAKNFEDINYDVKVKGDLDVAKIYKVFSQKGLDLDGYIKADVALKGKQSDATNGNYNKLNNSGTFVLKNIKTTSEFLPKPFVITDGVFKFNNSKLSFSNFKATYSNSNLMMNGYVQNFINYILSSNAVLKGQFDLKADVLTIDEFMSETSKNIQKSVTENKTTTEKGVVIIPSNLDLKFSANVKRINYDGLNIQDLKGNLALNKGKLNLQKSSFNIIDSNVAIDLFYQNINLQKANFNFHIITKGFDVKKAYKEVKLFREMASAAENAEGIVFLDYTVKGVLNKEMMPIYPSLFGGGQVSIKDVKMKGYKLFNAVSQKTSSEVMKDPKLSDVVIKTTIKNNIISIERFKLKVAGFRPRIEGTTNFDGRLNIKFRLGLPPLGIVGIPMTITGTKDKPKIKLGSKTDDIPEEEYITNDSIPKK
jgi:AsmA protein